MTQRVGIHSLMFPFSNLSAYFLGFLDNLWTNGVPR